MPFPHPHESDLTNTPTRRVAHPVRFQPHPRTPPHPGVFSAQYVRAVPHPCFLVKVFDLQSCCWSALKTYEKPPVPRGDQSATLVGTSVVIFGGQDAKSSLLNDLHILDLETLIWDEIDTLGVPPSPRFDHAAAVHGERYLLIFGGSSHATRFNDLHVLDLQTMEWSRPTQKGEVPNPRAVHAGATIGESWFFAGGGDNEIGASETVVLNMSTLAWSVVTTVEGCVPLASEMTENR